MSQYESELIDLISKLTEETKISLIYALITQKEQFLINNPVDLLEELLKVKK